MNLGAPVSSGELHCLKIKSKVASQACNACKKRKVKCVGNPCAYRYCVKKNYVCQFNIGKKRGPPKKMRFPKGVQECGTMSAVLLSHIQSSMDSVYRQNNFVDFYFQYIGRAIPKGFKAPLLAASDNELNSDLITQLYVISADVMKFFGNSDLEMQCIEKAHRYASTIFNSDSVESAVSLMMMANYVGRRHPKHKTYMNLAYNITDLPVVKDVVDAKKAKYSCHAQLVFLDDSLTTTQKYAYVVSKIFSLEDAKVLPEQVDMVSITSIKIKQMLLSYANFDDLDVSHFNTNNHLSAELREEMMLELAKLDETVKTMNSGHSNYIFSLFSAAHLRFIIEWRSGKILEALAAADNALKIYKDNKNVLGLWFHPGFVGALNLPYFFHKNGMPEKAKEILTCFEESATNDNAKVELRTAWSELCVKVGINKLSETMESSSPCDEQSPPLSPSLSPPSPTLSPPQTPETLCISQSILQSFEYSISQHVAQPISQLISQQTLPQQQQQQQTMETIQTIQQNIPEQTNINTTFVVPQQQTLLQQIIPQQQQQQQQIISQQQIIPQQIMYQQNFPQYTTLYSQQITYPQQQNFPQNTIQYTQNTFNFGTDTNINNNNSNNTIVNNNNNTTNNNNNFTNENPLLLSQSILYFDHDTLSDLLFSPSLPVFNDNMFL